MIAIRCTATPDPKARPVVKLPKRVARARRVAESKRLDNLRNFHDAIKKTAHEETRFVKDFFDKTSMMWDDPSSSDDEEKKFDVDEE
jgi:hypothetical protein